MALFNKFNVPVMDVVRQYVSYKIVVVLMPVALLLSGCMGGRLPVDYYLLQPVSVTSGAPLQTSVGIAPVNLPQWLSVQDIVWSDGEYRMVSAFRARWGEPLQQSVTRVLASNISRLSDGSSISVGPWLASLSPEYQVEVTLLSLENKNHQLTIEVRWGIFDKKNNRLQGEKRSSRKVYSMAVPHSSDDSAVFAQAFSQLLGRLSEDIAQDLRVISENR